MYALRRSEGMFSGGTKVEILNKDNPRAILVVTVGKIQRWTSKSSRLENDMQRHYLEPKGKPGPIEFVTSEDNLVKLRERTR